MTERVATDRNNLNVAGAIGRAEVFEQGKQQGKFGRLVKEVAYAILLAGATEDFAGVIAADNFQRIRDFAIFGYLAQQADTVSLLELDIDDQDIARQYIELIQGVTFGL